MTLRVAAVSTESILPVRMRVLREGTPSQDPRYPEDDLAITVHFAAFSPDNQIVATSTWLERAYPPAPHEPAIQLRGMAVLHELQGTGVGAELLRHGIAHARERGALHVWARARDSALRFYQNNGFAVEGDAFMDEATGMSHHLVVMSLSE